MKLPAGYRPVGPAAWFQLRLTALRVIVPIVLAAIFILLHDVSIGGRGADCDGPGGLRDDRWRADAVAARYNFSVAVWVGYIALYARRSDRRDHGGALQEAPTRMRTGEPLSEPDVYDHGVWRRAPPQAELMTGQRPFSASCRSCGAAVLV